MQEQKKICDILKFEGIMADGFGMAPRIVMRDQRLSIEAKAIYSYFQSFAGSSTTAFPSREIILRELNISKSRYYKYLNQLIECDYIRVTREETNGFKGRNVYVIVSNPVSGKTGPVKSEKKNLPQKNNSYSPQNQSQAAGKVRKEKHVIELKNPSISTVGGRVRTITETKNQIELQQKSNGETVSPLNQKQNRYGLNLAAHLKINELIEEYPEYRSDIKTIYYAAKDLIKSEEVRISGAVKKREAVLDIVRQITDKHVLFVLKNMTKHKKEIKNKRAWIQACLLNCIYESAEDIDTAIKNLTNEVNADRKSNGETVSSLKKEEKQQAEKAVISTHRYLSDKDKELRKLYSKRARATLNKADQRNDIEREIKSIEFEMQQYAKENNLPIQF